MLSCLEKCKELEVSCPCKECRLWVPSEDYLNCVQQVIDHYPASGAEDRQMGVRDVGEILGVSGQRVHQIEKVALKKLTGKLKWRLR